jgi:hypothetical protein
MGFNNLFRRIKGTCRPGLASHVWIDVHRLVEAYCHTVAEPFTVVFADLERRFSFSRSDPRRWPDLRTMGEVAEWLRARRVCVLAERAQWDEAQRREKARCRRAFVLEPLRQANAKCRSYAMRMPKVGYWGWRARRLSGCDRIEAPSK